MGLYTAPGVGRTEGIGCSLRRAFMRGITVSERRPPKVHMVAVSPSRPGLNLATAPKLRSISCLLAQHSMLYEHQEVQQQLSINVCLVANGRRLTSLVTRQEIFSQHS